MVPEGGTACLIWAIVLTAQLPHPGSDRREIVSGAGLGDVLFHLLLAGGG
jgi:hypothetical protein